MNTHSHLSPEQAVTGFYQLLNDRKYAEAFACLSDKFCAEKWRNDLADFAKGYSTTIEISDIVCREIKRDDASAEIDVRYVDKVNILRHALVDHLFQAADKTTTDIQESIAKFQEFLIENNIASPDKIASTPIDYLFGENGVEDYLWMLKADYSRNAELFELVPQTIQQHRIAVCIKAGDSWLIDDLKRDVQQ